MLEQFLHKVAWLAGCAAFFFVVEGLFPAIKGQRHWRKDTRVDLAHWFITPIFNLIIVRGLLLALIFAGLSGEDSAALLRGRELITSQPSVLVAIEALLITDLLIYWIHRLFHSRLAWPIHAVHHSSRKVDWLSAVRMHPIDSVVSRLLQAGLLAALGFPLAVATSLLFVVLPLQSYLVHSNLSWSFGPLTYVFVTPRFHRWHHTYEDHARNKNFGIIFVFWDLLFGTYYDSTRQKPERFGTGEIDEVPQTFLGQLWHPFRRRRRPASA